MFRIRQVLDKMRSESVQGTNMSGLVARKKWVEVSSQSQVTPPMIWNGQLSKVSHSSSDNMLTTFCLWSEEVPTQLLDEWLKSCHASWKKSIYQPNFNFLLQQEDEDYSDWTLLLTSRAHYSLLLKTQKLSIHSIQDYY